MLSSLSSKFLKTRFRILYVNFVKVVLKLILTINEPCIHYSYSIFKVRSACRREFHYNTHSRVCQAFFSNFFDRIFRCLLLKCLPSRGRLFDYITMISNYNKKLSLQKSKKTGYLPVKNSHVLFITSLICSRLS